MYFCLFVLVPGLRQHISLLKSQSGEITLGTLPTGVLLQCGLSPAKYKTYHRLA